MTEPIVDESRGNVDDRLTAVLSEYESLRTEIRDTFRLHLQLYTIVLSGIALSLGYVFTSRAYDLLFVVPVLSPGLLYRWL